MSKTIKDKSDTLNKCCYLSAWIAIIVSLLIFFIISHPLVLRSADDWRYINYWRDNAIPMLGRGWNPARILPEVLMPLAGSFGIYFLYPLGISFTRAVSISLGLFLVIFICIYLRSFELMIKKLFDVTGSKLSIITGIFLVSHFWILRSSQSGNSHLFDGGDPNLYFYYIIPFLLNYSLVFILFAYRNNISSWNNPRKAVLFLALYFAVFSNLFSSIIIFVYAGFSFILATIRIIKKREDFRRNICNRKVEIAVIIMWLYSLLAEANGGRAKSIKNTAQSIEVLERLFQSINNSLIHLSNMNKYYILFSIILLVCMTFFALKRKKAFEKMTHIWILSALNGICIYIYQVLLCSIVGPEYITRSSVAATYLICSVAVNAMIILCIVINVKESVVLLPMLLMIIISMCNTSEPAYDSALSWKALMRLDEYYISTIVEADQNGETEVIIHNPEWNSIQTNDSENLLRVYISSTLYKYRITNNHMNIEFD